MCPPEVLGRAQVESIALGEEQIRSVLRMRELYLHNLGALMRRRQELSDLLKVRLPHRRSLTGNVSAPTHAAPVPQCFVRCVGRALVNAFLVRR